MRNVICIALLLVMNCLGARAQCPEPTIEPGSKPLLEKGFKVSGKKEAEFFLNLKAVVPGTNWGKSNAEAAILSVFINDKYSQDIILFAGAEVHEYQALLGAFPAGKYKASIFLNKKYSARDVSVVDIKSANISPLFPKNTTPATFLAVKNAPFFYLRPNTIGKFSDIPLITYYEALPTESGPGFRYTTIFSNEDGGTMSQALMARWGRLTDIEWVYEFQTGKDGRISREIYQGANHETKQFTGKRIFGSHPQIAITTLNNNFSDGACSEMRVSSFLIGAELNSLSRESVMDSFPWTYRVMTEEALREGRVNKEKLGINTVADPREYIYIDIQTELKNAGVQLEITGKDGEKIISDENVPAYRISRNGFNRIAMRVPSSDKRFPDLIVAHCHPNENSAKGYAAEKGCRTLKLIRALRITDDFRIEQRSLQLSELNKGQKPDHWPGNADYQPTTLTYVVIPIQGRRD